MISLLSIETSTKTCSVALSIEGERVFERIRQEEASHASQLGVFVWEAVTYARTHCKEIDAVAVSSGPGSYTGLRIGVSEAKGLCYGKGIPLIAIPTLTILAHAVAKILLPEGAKGVNAEDYPYLCPMIDARRMEVYAALYDIHLREIRPVQAEIVEKDSYEEYLKKRSVLFCGDGSNKCRSLIQSPNAQFVDFIYPTAAAMIPLAEEAFMRKKFVDVAYFEPFYLKEFQATVAKNKVFLERK
ncbi:MAG: tRNA (adenosine(37)-N6)-threonylcarbamoyltransferase complex dimerization subunit type 1 TsaB [Candidatus Azobacteroides sp.]|nr:tRNA (adenosine(37)-N6)-threonylcarbamoyltransferase complex dimerization subunit type 1 TsaB [Candidatus Azobacteroides sp.]